MNRLLRACLAIVLLALAVPARAAPLVPDATALMDWAQTAYSGFFPGSRPTLTSGPYVYRYYPATGNYLGLAGDTIYIFGPVAGAAAAPVAVGKLADFACAVYPASCSDNAPGPADGGNVLFAADSRNGMIGAFPTLNPPPGTLVGTILSFSTAFGPALAYEAAHDRLIAGTSGNSIVSFERASTLAGRNPAQRIITPSIAGLSSLIDFVLDAAHDRLYVFVNRTYDGAIAVFEHLSTRQGTVVPDRLITDLPRGHIAIDLQRRLLYLRDNNYGSSVAVYPDIDLLNGSVRGVAGRSILMHPPGLGFGVAIDAARDRLVVALDRDDIRKLPAGLRIIDNASRAAVVLGAGTAFVYDEGPLFALPVATSGTGLALDAKNDRLYVGLGANVVLINRVSALSATQPALDAVATTAPNNARVTAFAFP